jgi:hypothetical protein
MLSYSLFPYWKKSRHNPGVWNAGDVGSKADLKRVTRCARQQAVLWLESSVIVSLENPKPRAAMNSRESLNQSCLEDYRSLRFV